MKNILFIKSLFIWKHAIFEWDGWRLKVYVQEKITIFAIITTQNNANGVVNQSILSVGCLGQSKVLMPHFRKKWFAGQKTSSNTQTSSAKVKCLSLARSVCTYWSCCKLSPAKVWIFHMKPHSLPLHCLQSNPLWALTQQSRMHM